MNISQVSRPNSADAERPSSHGVTIVIPAYNEKGGIEGVVKRVCALKLGVPLELLVVNDGSTDGTGEILARLEKEYETLRVIEHRVNMGYGAALKTGFSSAACDVVVITDADGTYPEDRIVELLAAIDDGAEMAIGARTGAMVKIPLIRRPAKAILRKLASYLAGTPIPDLNSGLRAFRRDFVLRYRHILPQGFSFTTTITLAGLTNYHRVDYISIDYAARTGNSKIRPIRDTLGFTALIIRAVLFCGPRRVFCPLAGVIGLSFLASAINDSFIQSPPNLSDKTVLMFVALVQVLTVGLLADLIARKTDH